MATSRKGYKGLPMEGLIATWYANNTSRDLRRFIKVAQAVTQGVPPGARVLEVAPGPGYCAIEIARSGRHAVTGVDISASFVRIARENASKAGVTVDFRHGNASQLPFPDASFDFVVCTAAFKNFSDPVGALNEIHRVLTPGGQASIYDLRKDASREEIATEVRDMHLSAIDAWLTRGAFRFMLLKRAYTRSDLEKMVARSCFGSGEIRTDGIGFELRLAKHDDRTHATIQVRCDQVGPKRSGTLSAVKMPSGSIDSTTVVRRASKESRAAERNVRYCS